MKYLFSSNLKPLNHVVFIINLRLVMENDSILVYHNMENSKVFCEKEPVPLEIQVEVGKKKF